MSKRSQLWKDIDSVVLRASGHMASLAVKGVGTEPDGWNPTDEICELITEAMTTDYVAHEALRQEYGEEYQHMIWNTRQAQAGFRRQNIETALQITGIWAMPDRTGNGGTDGNE